ncbi:MAG: MarR family transcriptional regulator, partial [Candidatus Delongbacteria bacterium]|nr:MarR family transcriptional regulator [Candidatus Delongbacteria bacterium]
MNERYSSILVGFFDRMSSWEIGSVSGRDISLPQVHLLEVVGNHESLKMKELSEKLGVTTGTLTVMVYRLIKKGFVVKEKDMKDNRSYLVRLTDKGKAEYDIHHRKHRRLIKEIVDVIGEDE